MRHWRSTLAAGAVALSLTGVAAAQSLVGSTPEERYFRIDSAVIAGRRGPEIEGYVYNVYDAPATRVRLRVEELDGAGQRLGERIIYVTLDVPPRGRSYFRAPVAAGTTSARVSVLYFDWTPRGGGGGGGGGGM